MKRTIAICFAAIGLLVGLLTTTLSVASAADIHAVKITPQLVAPGTRPTTATSRTNPCVFGWWTNKSTAMSAWWDRNGINCNSILKAHMKCNARTAFKNFDGPWEGHWHVRSRVSCPTNWHAYCVGIRYHSYLTGATGTEWVWPSSDCDTAPMAKTTASAGSVPASGRSSSSRRGCTSTYKWSFLQQLHNDEQGGYGEWTDNVGSGDCGYHMQVRVECKNPAGADYYHYSGEVRGEGIQDWATCNLFDSAVKFWIDPKDTNQWKCLAGCSSPIVLTAAETPAVHHRAMLVNGKRVLVNGPFYIEEHSGSFAAGFSSDSGGQNVIEVDKPGRFWYFDPTTTYQGDQAGYWLTTHSEYMSSQDSCNGVVLKNNAADNGTVWATHITSGHVYLINRRCDSLSGGPDTQALAGLGQHDSQFAICGSPSNCSGFFRNMDIFAAP